MRQPNHQKNTKITTNILIETSKLTPTQKKLTIRRNNDSRYKKIYIKIHTLKKEIFQIFHKI